MARDAKRTRTLAENVKTTTTSKWVFGGTGTLRDVVPLPPLLKLAIDAIIWLCRHPIQLVLVASFIAAIIINWNLVDAVFITLMAALGLALIKTLYIRYATRLRNRRYQRISHAPTKPITVPLDRQSAHGAFITLDRSILIGGENGSGKSNLVWHILDTANRYNIPYRLHVIDPKGGVEMQDLTQSPYILNYVDRSAKAEPLITKVRKLMDQRLDDMTARGTKKNIPTEQNPLHILIIDELLLLPNQLKEGVGSELAEILAVGRAASFIVVACTQLGQVDSIGRIRDLFAQRVCFAVRTQEMTDAILGTSATKDGATAHLLTRPGDGYVFSEDSDHEKYFFRFRAPFITDTLFVALAKPAPKEEKFPHPIRDRKAIAPRDHQLTTTTQPQLRDSGVFVDEPVNLTTRKAAVYQLYAFDGTPMYTGKAVSPKSRLKQHKQNSQPWFDQCDLSKTVITWYPTESDALDAEKQAIKAYRPIYNQIHNAY